MSTVWTPCDLDYCTVQCSIVKTLSWWGGAAGACSKHLRLSLCTRNFSMVDLRLWHGVTKAELLETSPNSKLSEEHAAWKLTPLADPVDGATCFHATALTSPANSWTCATVDANAFPAKLCASFGFCNTCSIASGLLKSWANMPWHKNISFVVMHLLRRVEKIDWVGRIHVDMFSANSLAHWLEVDVSTNRLEEPFLIAELSSACCTLSAALPSTGASGMVASKTASKGNRISLAMECKVSCMREEKSSRSCPSSKSANPQTLNLRCNRRKLAAFNLDHWNM